MAWLYKRNDSGLWWIGTRVNGRLVQKSTGESDKKKAMEKLAALEAMEAAQRANRLNRELFEELTGARIEPMPLFNALDTWVNEAIKPGTKSSYQNIAKQMRSAFAHNPPLSEITHEQIRAFLGGIRAKKRASTANLALACVGAFFSRFAGSVRKDPTEGIKRFKEDGTEVERQAFTPDQIRSIMATASPFWRFATAVAFCTGLRLSNVAQLKVGHVDLESGRIQVARTIKTGAKVCVKLPPAVLEIVRESIKPGANPDDYIWPERARDQVSALSEQFGEILIKAGIRKRAEGAGNGKTGRRNVNALTFHSLRHAIITALANSGVNQQTVKKLVGHANDRINDAYTHIGQETIDTAAALLPDITAKPEVTK